MIVFDKFYLKKCLWEKTFLFERIALNTYSLCVPVLEAMKSQYWSNKLEFFRITIVNGRHAKSPNHPFWVLGVLGKSTKADLNLISQICHGKNKPSLQPELCNSLFCEFRNTTVVSLLSLPTFPRFWISYLCV